MNRVSSISFNLTLAVTLLVSLFVSLKSVAAVISLEDPAIVQAKTVVNPQNGHTYHLISGEATPDNPMGGLTWSAADEYAKSLSSDTVLSGLVSINSAAEQNWLATQFPAIHSDQGEMHQVIWIGLTDHHNEGVYCWENGEKVEHTNWASNLPNDPDGREDFVYLTNTSMFDPFIPEGTWNDHHDEPVFFGALPFSAIIEVQSIPEPSTALLMFLSSALLLRRRR